MNLSSTSSGIRVVTLMSDGWLTISQDAIKASQSARPTATKSDDNDSDGV